MKAFVFLAILAASVCSKKVSYQSCSSVKLLGEDLFVDVIPCDADPCVLKRGGYYQSHASRSCHQCIDLRVRAQTVANFQFQCIGRLRIALSSKRRHSSEARIHLKSQRTLPPPPQHIHAGCRD